MTYTEIKKANAEVLYLLADYINNMADCITPQMMKETAETCGVDTESAFRILMMGILDVYENKELRLGWFSKMFTRLEREKYENDPYKKTIRFPNVKDGEWEFTTDRYRPYEAFVFDDLKVDGEGRVIPSIGFFEEEYTFPVVKQGGREWMLITPNEIETMKGPVEEAYGDVVTYGLGLGYFTFMASAKDCVKSVTVVEKDKNVIELFEKHLLWQFPFREKIKIVCEDAFSYAQKGEKCDFVFADIWHDPSDGCELYLRLKKYEKEGTRYAYWIENTMKYYLGN